MKDSFYQGAFLGRWHAVTRHDLSASHSQTLSLAALLSLATELELAEWDALPLSYSTPEGGQSLRCLIAARYQTCSAAEVICCAGAQESMACLANALLQPGDHAIVVLPIYQPLETVVTDRVNATGVPLDPGSFTLDLDRVAAAIRPQTRMILTNFPNSPSGATLDPASQAALVALCRARGIWLVNDEVYRTTVTNPAVQGPPIVDAYERGVSIDALSKGFGLPGLRVGWIACRDAALRGQIGTAKAAMSSCLAAPSELLARIALREAPRLVARSRAIGAANWQRFDLLMERHAKLFDAGPSRNLAFAFPRYLGRDGVDDFAAGLARRAGVLILPSSLWRTPLGPVPDDRFRISMGQSAVPDGLDAMAEFLAEAHLGVP